MDDISNTYSGNANRESPLKRWVRQPEPGQFRGEGEWVPFIGSDAAWRDLVTSRFVPTHEGDLSPSPLSREARGR